MLLIALMFLVSLSHLRILYILIKWNLFAADKLHWMGKWCKYDYPQQMVKNRCKWYVTQRCRRAVHVVWARERTLSENGANLFLVNHLITKLTHKTIVYILLLVGGQYWPTSVREKRWSRFSHVVSGFTEISPFCLPKTNNFKHGNLNFIFSPFVYFNLSTALLYASRVSLYLIYDCYRALVRSSKKGSVILG